ncbi:MAG TPA: CbiX/SirB N-terminal domain-containing protein [Arachnia sp.]|nr:CbiX/SirB N-terminal domain-containing protein [Arachnia sp.]HMT87708.1 CbiX/SirB N-terminal domain-containing protein [Arachnia sp.]
MVAPAIVLTAPEPDDLTVSGAFFAIRRTLAEYRPDLTVELGFLGGLPTVSEVVAQLGEDERREIVLVPLDLSSAAGHDPRLDEECAMGLQRGLNVVISRPIGPATELLNILDERVREALQRRSVLELDALVLSAPVGGDIRGNGLLARRARQWSAHHKLPVQLAVDEGDGRATATAVSTLRGQGRRSIAVGSLYLTPDAHYVTHQQSALRAGAVAVTEPIGHSEHLCQLILARYAFGAMELLDGHPHPLALDEDDEGVLALRGDS